MLRWTLTLLTVALIGAGLIFTDLYTSTIFTNIGRVFLIVSGTGTILTLIFAFTGRYSIGEDFDHVWREEDTLDHLRAKVKHLKQLVQFWEGKFRTVKLENNRIRKYNLRLGDNLSEAGARLADVINQAAADQKRYEAEIARLREVHDLPERNKTMEIAV